MKDMKEILKRCQELQVEVFAMNNEYSLNVDTFRSMWKGSFLSTSVHLFNDNKIEKSWYFYDWRSEEENEKFAADMEKYIKNLKK